MVPSGDAQVSGMAAEILEKTSQLQKRKGELEAQIRDLRAQLDAEIEALRSWAADHAVGSSIAWPMTAARVVPGFFAHDIIAATVTEGVEVRCQLTANESNKHLQAQYPPGTPFTCAGRVTDIAHAAHATVVTLVDAKVHPRTANAPATSNKISIQPKLDTQRVSAEAARRAIELFQAACAPLFTTHAADVVEVKATVHDGWS